MAQNQTESVNLAVAAESTLGTLPTANWFNLQPNSYGNFGPTYKKVARTPISKNRQTRQGIVVDLDSFAPWQADITKDLLDNFLQGIFMSAVKNNGGTGTALFRPTAVTAGAPASWTVASGGAVPNNALVYGRGFTNSANNGLHPANGTSTGTSVKTNDTLVTEVPPSNATLEVAGLRGASGDLQLDANGNLISTVLDFTTFGLQVGQWIWVGGTAGGANAFATATYRGFAKITAVAAHIVNLARRSWTVGSADTGTGKTIDIYFSRWARNVPYDHADFLKTSYSFEVTYPDLSAPGTAEYEYILGQFVDQFTFSLPLTAKATADMSFKGTSAQDPTTVRGTGIAGSVLNPLTQVAVSTATDLMRLRVSNVDETGVSTDFQMLKIILKNNVSPEKELGVLGATIMNIGRFECPVEADCIFTSDQVIKKTHDGSTATLDVAMRNGDFGALLDVMQLTIDDTQRKFPTNASVLVSTKMTGFQDPTYNSTAGLTVFPFLPSS